MKTYKVVFDTALKSYDIRTEADELRAYVGGRSVDEDIKRKAAEYYCQLLNEHAEQEERKRRPWVVVVDCGTYRVKDSVTELYPISLDSERAFAPVRISEQTALELAQMIADRLNELEGKK